MKVAQISKRGGDFELVDREIPQPRAEQVRVKVEGLRHLPQRRGSERGRVAGTAIPKGAGS
jgi:hypothetical protein